MCVTLAIMYRYGDAPDQVADYVSALDADGIFVPGATAPNDPARLANAIHVRLNVLVVPDLPLPELARLGVRRVSTGSLPYRAAIDAAVQIATSVRDAHPFRPPAPKPHGRDQHPAPQPGPSARRRA
jgi:2-methylisocitrate lyase-like PEP mutase family enzyme